MKLKKWALIAEIIGGIAVVLTLFVLILEVRRNTAVLGTSAFQSVTESWTDFTAMLAADAELARIYQSGRIDPRALNAEDLSRFEYLMITVGRRIESAYMLQQSGLLSTQEAEGFRAVCRSVLGTGGGHEWFKGQENIFTQSFGEFVNSGCDVEGADDARARQGR